MQEDKKKFNRFLFDIVNQFSLNEFTNYTNFTEVMKRVLEADGDPTKQGRLNRYIKDNFKRTVPDEKMWKKGGFISLRLTEDFYESETAARIFGKLFGIKNCTVALSKVLPQSVRVDKGDSRRQSSVSDTVDDEDPMEQVRTTF